MSHFTVLVTNTNEDYNDVEKQLEPFNEDRRMPSHISKTRRELIEAGRKDVEYAKKKVAEYDKDPEAYKKGTSNDNHLKWITGEARETAKITDEEEMFKIGAKWYKDDLDEEGNYWSEANDDAKWDWYEIGGRWAGFFIPKKDSDSGKKGKISLLVNDKDKEDFLTNERVDVIKIKDIDWSAMEEAEKERRAKYYDEQMAKPKNNRFVWSETPEADEKATKEEYINRPIFHSTFAILHKGRWYERGNMGWFGIATNEKDTGVWEEEWRKFVENLDPETEVTIVDCHI